MSNIKCRTCFQTLQPNYRLSLKTEVSLGKTVEEILHFFMPEMIKAHFIDEFICSRCMDAIKIFMDFVKKFIDVENYLKGIIIKQQKIEQNIFKESGREDRSRKTLTEISKKNCVDKEKSNYENLQKRIKERLDELLKDPAEDRERSRKGLQLPFNEDTNFIKPQKTYSYIKRSRPTSQEECTEVPDSPNSGTNLDLADDSILCEIITETSTNSSEEQQVDIFHNSAGESQICELCGGDFVCDSCSNINCINSISDRGEILEVNETEDKVEENTKCIENSLIFKTNPPTTPEQKTERETDSSKTLPNTTKDSLSTTILENGTVVGNVRPKFSDIPVSGDRNRTISVTANETEIVDFVKNYSLYNINLFKLDLQQKAGPKRILLLGNTLLYCRACKEYFPSRASLKAHFQELHPGNIHTSEDFKTRYFYIGFKECPVCKEKFRGQSMLEKHMISQHKESHLYNCNRCGMKFKRGEFYKRHLKIYELYQDCSIRKCSICGKMVNRDLYLKHRKTHQGIQCDICKIRLMTYAQIDIHRSRYPSHKVAEFNQTPKNKALCPVCGKLVLRPQLRVHLQSHTETRSFLCDKCSKSFKSKYCLVKHIEIVHSDARPYECSICNTKTKTRCALRCHVSLKHFKVYSHVCHICGAGFTRGDYFSRHVKRHSLPGYRFKKYRYHSTQPTDPIPCKYCNKKFKRVVSLRMHLLSKHTKNFKRPKCHYCDMTFSNVANRLRHEKRHQNPDTFELTCNVCYNRLGSKEELDVHFVKHKDSQRWICEICGESCPSKHFLYHHKGEKHFDKEMVENEKTIVLKEGLSHVMVDKV